MKLDAKFDPKDLDRIKRALAAVNPQARGNIVFKAIQIGSLYLEEKLRKYDSFSSLGKVFQGLTKSIGSKVTQQGKLIIGVIGSGASPFAGRVPYATIHETGGNITVTPKMRGFAFWQYKITKNPMWIGIANSSVVKIKASHYMSKTLNANESAAIKKVVGVIDDELRKVLSK
jgi:hypothetical protein